MKKITNSAKGQNCTVRLPGICSHDPEKVVFAHLDGIRYGKGRGLKAGADDLAGKRIDFGAYACFECHNELTNPKTYKRDYLDLAHLEATIETQIILINSGLMVAGN